MTAWLLVAISFAVLWTWWQFLMFVLKLLDRAREDSVPYWGEAEDSPKQSRERELSVSRR